MEQLFKELVIDTAPVDIENGVKRSPLGYQLYFPQDGINEDTGLIVFVDGFAGNPDYVNLLRRYLSAKYNCIVLTATYFGFRLKNSPQIFPYPDFYEKLQEKYGVATSCPEGVAEDKYLNHVLENMSQHGMTELAPECRVYSVYEQEYDNIGVLPAIDHLSALQDCLERYSVNTGRLYAFGTSYGAYIVMLMAKFAPNTFNLVIENSGYVSSNNEPILIENRKVAYYKNIRLMCHEVSGWSIDPASNKHFKPYNKEIRDLREAKHYGKGKAEFFLFLGEDDHVISIDDKRQLAETLSKDHKVSLKIVTEKDIDGKLFKHTKHAMGASLKDLFDYCMERYEQSDNDLNTTTDFGLNSRLRFDVTNHCYILDYKDSKNFHLQLYEVRPGST